MEMFLSFLRFLFGLWPLVFTIVLVSVLLSKESRKTGIYGIARSILVWWCLWAVMGVVLLLGQIQFFLLFPEPWNTLLFLCCGFVPLMALLFPIIRQTLKERQLLISSRQIEDLLKLSPEDFEELAAAYFRRAGNKVRRVGETGDHGIDLIVYSPRYGKCVVQCKRYKGGVGEPIVRDFYGTMFNEHASRGVIMTTGNFTVQAVRWAVGKPIQLVEGEELVRLLQGEQTRTEPLL
jgi:restriction system protein